MIKGSHYSTVVKEKIMEHIRITRLRTRWAYKKILGLYEISKSEISRWKKEIGKAREKRVIMNPCKIMFVEMAAPYLTDAIDPMMTINIAKAEDYALKKCSGVVNLIPLYCLYGNSAAAILKRVQRKNKQIPMLNIMYDGLKSTNEEIRIEAFINQAKIFHEIHYTE